jgi:hypothetical protein
MVIWVLGELFLGPSQLLTLGAVVSDKRRRRLPRIWLGLLATAAILPALILTSAIANILD